MIKIKLIIENMTCGACESRIENNLKNKNGISNVKANHSAGTVEVEFEEKIIKKEEIIKEIEKLHYIISNKEDNNNESIKTIAILFIILLIYIVIKHTIGFNFLPVIDQNMSYSMLFIVGIITSLHCMAMCGGINLSQCVKKEELDKEITLKQKIQPSFLYNLGRVTSYTLIGGIVGAIGSVFSFSNFTQGLIQIIAGLLMLIMGMKMINLFPFLKKINIRMPKFFANKLYSNKIKKGPFYIGLLNGLMPCGPLQTMQLYALGTGSFFAGALSMFFFSIGTVPLMFGLGALSTILSNNFTKNMMKISAILIVVLGINMASRGIVLSGIDFSSILNKVNSTSSIDGNIDTKENNGTISTQNGNVQEITTKLTSPSDYPTITVKAGIPVKWTISAEKKYLNGCNNEIVIPKYNIEQKLNVGDTIIEFTPDQTGTFAYSCWMGMIRGKIKVVKDTEQNNTSNTVKDDSVNNEKVDTTGLPSCCGS